MMYTVHNMFNNLYASFQTVLVAVEKYDKELGQGKEKMSISKILINLDNIQSLYEALFLRTVFFHIHMS